MENLVKLTIDGVSVEVPAGTTVLEAAKKAGIKIPTLCYLKDINQIGACRMCVVEDEKTGKIDTSCSMQPRDGMRIRTNTGRLLKHRRMILELMLASHNCECTT